MKIRTWFLASLIGACLALPSLADDKKPELTETQFRRASALLLEDPLADAAGDYAKVALIFVMESPKAAVMLGEEEMKWIGKDNKRSLVLLGSYLAGNAQSQLNSGVKRNDRYSGLLYLFQTYRQIQAKNKDFKIAEVEDLLKLHKEDKLVGHLIELEKKKPTKLTPEQEEAVRKLLKRKE